MDDKPLPLDQRLVRALGHPLRVRILELLTSQVSSPNRLKEPLDAPLSHVSYHVRILEENEAVELVRQEQRRGAIEHYFRATAKSFIGSPGWRRVPKLFLGVVGSASLLSFTEQAVEAIRAGHLDDERAAFVWMPIVVDDQGREEVGEFREGAVEKLLDIQARSKRRLARQAEDGTQYLVAVGGFQAAGTA